MATDTNTNGSTTMRPPQRESGARTAFRGHLFVVKALAKVIGALILAMAISTLVLALGWVSIVPAFGESAFGLFMFSWIGVTLYALILYKHHAFTPQIPSN